MKHMWSEEEINKAPKVLDSLVDSKGNPRFIEGDGVPLVTVPTGVTISYAKWSLSGSHLMIVLAGSIANATALTASGLRYKYEMPSYILDKVYAVWGNSLELKTVSLVASDYTTQAFNARIFKDTGHLAILNQTGVTLTADRSFRVQFDLLIDTE